MQFTDTLAPLFIDVEGDCTQGLFVIATSQPPGVPIPTSQNSYRPMSSYRKREREETPIDINRPNRAMKIVRKVEADAISRNIVQSREHSQIPEFALPLCPPGSSSRSSPPVLLQPSQHSIPSGIPLEKEEPLFLPSSQLTIAENNFLKEAGLGDIETLGDLNALLEGEGEEVEFPPSQVQSTSGSKLNQNRSELQLDKHSESIGFDDMDFGPTQITQKVCLSHDPLGCG